MALVEPYLLPSADVKELELIPTPGCQRTVANTVRPVPDVITVCVPDDG